MPIAQTGLATKEKRLARDGRNHRKLEGLGNEKSRLRPLAGQETLRGRR